MATKAQKAEDAKLEVRKMTQLMTRYTLAVRAHETRGGGRPEDVADIEREYLEAHRLLEMNIGYLINKAYA